MASDGGTGGPSNRKTSAPHPRSDRSVDSPSKRHRTEITDPDETSFSGLSTRKKVDFLVKKGLSPATSEQLARDRPDYLCRGEIVALDRQDFVNLQNLGLAHIVREARGRLAAETSCEEETFWDHLRQNPTAKATLQQFDLIARYPELLDEIVGTSLMKKIALNWLDIKPSLNRSNPELKATTRQYNNLQRIWTREVALTSELKAKMREPLDFGPEPQGTGLSDFGTFFTEPTEQLPGDGSHNQDEDEEIGDETNNQDEPEPEPSSRDVDREDWEFGKITAAIADKGSLTPKQVEWMAEHLNRIPLMTENQCHALIHSRSLQIVNEGENPSVLRPDTTYTELDKILMENDRWKDLTRAASHLQLLLRLHSQSENNPLGIRMGTGTRRRGRSPPSDEIDYFELTAFERCYRSATRDVSRDADERDGLYSGRRETGVRAPEKHGPQPGEDQIQTVEPLEEEDRPDKSEPTAQIIRQDHLMTLPGKGKETEVIATYEGKALRDTIGVSIRVGVDDAWFRKIWRLQSDGQRVTNSPMRVIRVKARCCQIFEPQEGAPQLRERLSITPPIEGERVSSSYVGISGIAAQLVYVKPRVEKGTKKPIVYSGPFYDDFSDFDFKNEPSQTMAGQNTILSESCLIPRNLSQIKKFIAGKTRRFGAEENPIRASIRQNQMALAQLTPKPLQHVSLESSEGTPNIGQFYNRDGVDTHYMLRLLPLSAFSVPEELVIRIRAFLSSHPLDPMSVNVAIQATGVYLYLRKALDLGAEGMAYHKRTLKHPVPAVDLDVFILMYPHWLRFTENMRMTRHMHPFRFIAMAYRRDLKLYQSHLVKNGTLDVEKMQQLFDQMRETARGNLTNLVIPVLPASMPGTRMKWPAGVTVGAPPTKELASLCLLDDIRTLGLPSYHNRSAATQLIAVPESLAKNMKVDGKRFYVQPVPTPEFWNPNMKSSLVAQTGNAKSIGPVFKPLTGSKMGPRSQIEGVLGEAHPGWLNHVLPQPVEHLMSKHAINAITQRNVRRLELAQEIGIPSEKLRWNPDELVLTWDDIQSEVILNIAAGSLPAIRETVPDDVTDDEVDEVSLLYDDEVTSPADASFHQDPEEVALLVPSETKAFRQLLDGMHIHAMDWNHVRQALNAEVPLKKDVVTHLHRVYSDLLKEVITVGASFWESEAPGGEINEAAMKCAPFHLARLAGTMSADETSDPLKFTEAIDPQIPNPYLEHWEAIKMIGTMLGDPKPMTWNITKQTLYEFYNSDLVRQQVGLLMQLVAQLKAFPEDWPQNLQNPLRNDAIALSSSSVA